MNTSNRKRFGKLLSGLPGPVPFVPAIYEHKAARMMLEGLGVAEEQVAYDEF